MNKGHDCLNQQLP